MPIMPSPRTQISHPTWCVGAHNDPANHTDPIHESGHEPMVCTADDFLIATSLWRSDEIPLATGQQEICAPGIVLGMTSLCFEDQRGRPVQVEPLLTVDEARHLAATLLRLADQAETETVEVIW